MASDGNLTSSVQLDAGARQHRFCRPVFWSSVVLSALFGGIWIWAGAVKAREPILFLMDIRSFQMLGDPWAAWLALCLPWLEIFCGVCVLIRRFYLAALVILTGSLSAFLYAILSAQSRGLDITCGCFGKSDNKTDYPDIIARDILLLIVALALIGAALWLGKIAKQAGAQ